MRDFLAAHRVEQQEFENPAAAEAYFADAGFAIQRRHARSDDPTRESVDRHCIVSVAGERVVGRAVRAQRSHRYPLDSRTERRSRTDKIANVDMSQLVVDRRRRA